MGEEGGRRGEWRLQYQQTGCAPGSQYLSIGRPLWASNLCVYLWQPFTSAASCLNICCNFYSVHIPCAVVFCAVDILAGAKYAEEMEAINCLGTFGVTNYTKQAYNSFQVKNFDCISRANIELEPLHCILKKTHKIHRTQTIFACELLIC